MSSNAPSPNAVKAVQDERSHIYTVIENVKGKRIRLTCPDYVDDASINLSENSIKVLQKRYLRRDLDGTYLETPAGMFYRVAYHIAQVEKEHHGDAEAMTRVFYDLLAQRRFFPNSPTFTGAGTPLGQLAACFVLPIEDDMGRAADGIFSTLRVAPLIQQTGGGNGFSFSRLRPKNDVVHTSSGRATGPVGFLRVYDQAFGEIAQGGSRRGANMGVLRVDHPDIEEFIECKAEEGKIANFNISVAITDEFMNAVKEDKDFDLRNPRDGKVWKTVRAHDLFAKIVRYAHHNGEPGALFIDAANRANPVPHLYDLEATNPCVTGDTLIYTARGLRRARDLYATQEDLEVVLDSRFGTQSDTGTASPVFYTGDKPVFRLETSEGFALEATGNHRVMTARGWVPLEQLRPGDKVHVLNRKGRFGRDGSLALGRAMGWFFGNRALQAVEAAEDEWFGDERMPVASGASNAMASGAGDLHHIRFAPSVAHRLNGAAAVRTLDERAGTSQMAELLVGSSLDHVQAVPEIVYTGSEAMQRGFLQGLFSSNSATLNRAGQGVNVRLWSTAPELLRGVQKVLLNFGIAARIYWNRVRASYLAGRDGEDRAGDYSSRTGHELVIAKDNLLRFRREIGFLARPKQQQLDQALEDNAAYEPVKEYFVATVRSVTPLGVQPVYDLTEPLTHSFVADGIVVHNCGEQWLGPYENCCLGSVNLAQHVTEDADGRAVVDWDQLRRTVYESTSFLDNVVSANGYVPTVPEVAEAAYRARRIGLGIMGLGDMMYRLGIRYGSREGQEFAAQIMEFVRYSTMEKSIELAEERGPFLAFPGSIYDKDRPGGMLWQPPKPLFPFTHDWGRPALDWEEIVQGIGKYGIRNAAQTTVAPTGTIATVVGCEGYGCEPVFALGYIRHFKDGDKDVELYYMSPLFEEALNATDLSEAEKQQIKQYVATYGSCQGLKELPEHMRHTFVVSGDITAEEHVLMQASIQAFTDNSISKTCNFPEGATEEDVAKAYMLAWETGCKGLTVYVTGSRQQVVLETKATREKKDEPAGSAAESELAATNGVNGYGAHHADDDPGAAVVNFRHTMVKRPRPSKLKGSTYRKETPLGTAYITVNSDERDEPFEVFLNVGKAGTEVTAVSEAIGRLISLILRMPATLPPTERLRWVMDEMAGIGGGRPLGFGANRVRSLPDGIAQVLAEHLSELPPATADEALAEQLALPIAAKPIGDICPECGEASFLNVEGCRKCAACGYSEC
ncbi:MAG: hypothetical protein H3C34_07405 [Caldilineaceae bacterium]|nr:hypothetical protein [Caldilineaceae bacterium]